jgi:hypothetical protein
MLFVAILAVVFENTIATLGKLLKGSLGEKDVFITIFNSVKVT